MSRGALGRAAAVIVLASIWSLAAWLLWSSSVVPALHLPHVDEHAYFSAAVLHAAQSFGRFQEILWVISTLVELAVLVLYARYGARFARESAAGRAGTGMLLGMLGFALVWAAQLPFSVAELWWERRHHLTHLGYVSTVLGNWLALGAQFTFLCLALAIVMGFARLLREWWWLAGAPAFVGLALLFAFVSPYLIPTHRLASPQLRAATAKLEAIEHVKHVPVVVETVHDVTSLPNAEATGLGPSRRVVLWDTIVSGFTPREVTVVIAHELGHLEHDHIWKDVGWYALFAFPGTFLIARLTRRRGGMAEPLAIPLSLLVLVLLNLIAQPLQNVVSRHLEAEADWSALQATHDPAAATALFRHFVPTTLGEPNPSTFDYVMLENHPTVMQRIAMAKAYATSAAQSP
ncbi:MAG TPA: M48 family metalloprotease [Gaiellaceae bacterium]|nr:M48 family metalloprotease [Gaiellaceae bacterium]